MAFITLKYNGYNFGVENQDFDISLHSIEKSLFKLAKIENLTGLQLEDSAEFILRTTLDYKRDEISSSVTMNYFSSIRCQLILSANTKRLQRLN